jgi:hypothetical protein
VQAVYGPANTALLMFTLLLFTLFTLLFTLLVQAVYGPANEALAKKKVRAFVRFGAASGGL